MDAKSYLTGVFPLRLETQEGLIDQLVQIKMFDLPDDYLETYRQHIQAVTIEEIQAVAKKYVRADEAAIVIVGDGAELLEQVKPYTDAIELYNTAGKRKAKPSANPDSKSESDAALIVGDWTIEIQTPFGQNIPASLKVWQTETGMGGSVASEMGDANIISAALTGNSFTAILSFEMGGRALEAKIAGEIDGTQMDGSISLQDSPELPFTATKTS
jgi:hypothetical protein